MVQIYELSWEKEGNHASKDSSTTQQNGGTNTSSGKMSQVSSRGDHRHGGPSRAGRARHGSITLLISTIPSSSCRCSTTTSTRTRPSRLLAARRPTGRRRSNKPIRNGNSNPRGRLGRRDPVRQLRLVVPEGHNLGASRIRLDRSLDVLGRHGHVAADPRLDRAVRAGILVVVGHGHAALRRFAEVGDGIDTGGRPSLGEGLGEGVRVDERLDRRRGLHRHGHGGAVEEAAARGARQIEHGLVGRVADDGAVYGALPRPDGALDVSRDGGGPVGVGRDMFVRIASPSKERGRNQKDGRERG